MEKITADTVLNWAREQVESKKMPSREVWLDMAFRLNLLRIDEAQTLNEMRQKVANYKLAIMETQVKRNVAAAEIEVEGSDEYRLMRNQEVKVDVIEEFVRIAKKNSDQSF